MVESLNDSPPSIPRLLSGVEGPPNNWVLKNPKEGYHIPFSSLPPITITPEIRIQYLQDPVGRKFLASAVKEMEEKAAIEIVSSPDPGFYSRIFLVPKSENKWRPIIDVRECAIPFLMFTLHTHDSRSSF
jgi:hypothetical protein